MDTVYNQENIEMIRRKTQQLSFTQLQVKNCINTAHWLHKVNDIIDWAPTRKRLAGLHPSNTGRPAYDPVLMFKILLLQQWFGLSDPQAEAQINDRISFKVFLNMEITQTGPDETTICLFRKQLGDLVKELFEEINRQIEKKGVVVKAGTLIDATFILLAQNHLQKTRSLRTQKLPGEQREKARIRSTATVTRPILEWTRILA